MIQLHNQGNMENSYYVINGSLPSEKLNMQTPWGRGD